MRKIILLLISIIVLSSCSNELNIDKDKLNPVGFVKSYTSLSPQYLSLPPISRSVSQEYTLPFIYYSDWDPVNSLHYYSICQKMHILEIIEQLDSKFTMEYGKTYQLDSIKFDVNKNYIIDNKVYSFKKLDLDFVQELKNITCRTILSEDGKNRKIEIVYDLNYYNDSEYKDLNTSFILGYVIEGIGSETKVEKYNLFEYRFNAEVDSENAFLILYQQDSNSFTYNQKTPSKELKVRGYKDDGIVRYSAHDTILHPSQFDVPISVYQYYEKDKKRVTLKMEGERITEKNYYYNDLLIKDVNKNCFPLSSMNIDLSKVLLEEDDFFVNVVDCVFDKNNNNKIDVDDIELHAERFKIDYFDIKMCVFTDNLKDFTVKEDINSLINEMDNYNDFGPVYTKNFDELDITYEKDIKDLYIEFLKK